MDSIAYRRHGLEQRQMVLEILERATIGWGGRRGRVCARRGRRPEWAGLRCGESPCAVVRAQVHRIMEEMHQELVNEAWFGWCARKALLRALCVTSFERVHLTALEIAST